MPKVEHHDPTAGRSDQRGTGAYLPGHAGASADTKAGEGGYPAPPSALTVDWKLFEHHLAEEDLTDQEKREFIEALWYIIVSFVDLGFGIEPVNQAMRAAALDHLQPASAVADTRTDSAACDQNETQATTSATNPEESERKERTQ